MSKSFLNLPLWMVIAYWWLRKQEVDGGRSVDYLELDSILTVIIRSLPVPRTRVQRRVTQFLISRIWELRMDAWRKEMHVVRDVLGHRVIF